MPRFGQSVTQVHLMAGATFVLLFAVFPSVGAGEGGTSPDDPILTAASARIAEHRMADLELLVQSSDGPIPNATVAIEQTRHAFLFGCNIFRWGQGGSPEAVEAYKERYKDVFNFATLGFYWPSYESRQGEPLHENRMQVARWCDENGIVCKGHPLAWNYSEPRWLPDNSEEIFKLQLARIDDCVTHFRGLIDCWDVVNEVAHFDREHFIERAPKFTQMWREVGQIEFTKACFEEARRANPDATLLINDYRTDVAYEQVIEKLVDGDGRPLYDVIGIQSHMHGGEWSSEQLWNTCERFKRFGVPLHFTELTVVSGRYGWQDTGPRAEWPSTAEGEAKQAAHVERIYTILFSHPAVEAITWWDFSDDGAWQQAPAGFLRRDMSPKPSYEALHRLIKSEWWTNETARTDDQGKAEFRGFLGDYQVRIETPDGLVFSGVIRLERGKNVFVIEPTATRQ